MNLKVITQFTSSIKLLVTIKIWGLIINEIVAFTLLSKIQSRYEFRIWNPRININQNSSLNCGETKLQFSKIFSTTYLVK